jgi:hypothetical protein
MSECDELRLVRRLEAGGKEVNHFPRRYLLDDFCRVFYLLYALIKDNIFSKNLFSLPSQIITLITILYILLITNT